MWRQNRNDARARRHRIPLPLRVRARLINRNGQSPAVPPSFAEDTLMENISQFGCYFLLTVEPTLGSDVEMEITIPVGFAGVNAGKVHCQGRVVRIEKQPASDKTGVACTIDRFHLVPLVGDSQTA